MSDGLRKNMWWRRGELSSSWTQVSSLVSDRGSCHLRVHFRRSERPWARIHISPLRVLNFILAYDLKMFPCVSIAAAPLFSLCLKLLVLAPVSLRHYWLAVPLCCDWSAVTCRTWDTSIKYLVASCVILIRLYPTNPCLCSDGRITHSVINFNVWFSFTWKWICGQSGVEIVSGFIFVLWPQRDHE